ncbi:DUF4194 domain-containing protein [Phaeodactylibacter xiamenensis]|jgi:hypothetical protein|uniref:DUF4194 domain-containing protein n=1 Tax=Phaeodactylibacter xiamenensis TaxID=1524460 RepID=A0A098S6B2_9BACT|nr:DUF4194 domain-containing protein [Phaeodactylibacter xiamenensis]KGE87616.1 hypothetical protein IX84_13790 [Phaeodactylibacter xiamenensis]
MSEPTVKAEIRAPAIYLLKGILYREQHLDAWNLLLRYRERLRAYFEVLGLELIVEEGDGYAYLRQQPEEEEADPQPRLMTRRRLSYQQTLLIVLLRKRLLEFESEGNEVRLVLRYSDIAEMMRLYWDDTAANERKQEDKLRADIKKMISFGFLQTVREEDRYEVSRILKAYVPIEKLNEILGQLKAYAEAQKES